MKQLFPVEIIENTTQAHLVKHQIKTKIVYLVIIFITIIICFSLPFIYVDVSTQSRGVIKTPVENNTLQSAIYAQIEDVNIFENKAVNIGDTLLWLKTDELDEQISRLGEKQVENELFIEDLNRLLSGNANLSTPKYTTEYAQYRAKVGEQRVDLKQQEREYVTSKKLFEKGVEARHDYEQVQSKYEASKSQLQLLKEQQLATWQAEKTRLELENKDSYSQLLQIEKRKSQYYIIAPITGNVIQCIGLQKGSFLSPGQSIAQITSSDSLIVECYVSPSDIAYIAVGQKVFFQMDAFDYQQWGLLEGRVDEIISDIVELNNQPFFKVWCTTDRNYLELSNGYRGNLKRGMSTTARFFLTRRSLAQLLFDKIDNWLNPKIMTDGNNN